MTGPDVDCSDDEPAAYYGYRFAWFTPASGLGVDYKSTTAAPTVSVAGGTIQGRYLSQHLAAGLGVAW